MKVKNVLMEAWGWYMAWLGARSEERRVGKECRN